mmetsp:Transcript_43784/g.95319  ORF Transcript_43784/g.95319 Transcript_43784/m.95319 type:complete len:299 (-) Transcript_43784:2137-3033(-)
MHSVVVVGWAPGLCGHQRFTFSQLRQVVRLGVFHLLLEVLDPCLEHRLAVRGGASRLVATGSSGAGACSCAVHICAALILLPQMVILGPKCSNLPIISSLAICQLALKLLHASSELAHLLTLFRTRLAGLDQGEEAVRIAPAKILLQFIELLSHFGSPAASLLGAGPPLQLAILSTQIPHLLSKPRNLAAVLFHLALALHIPFQLAPELRHFRLGAALLRQGLCKLLSNGCIGNFRAAVEKLALELPVGLPGTLELPSVLVGPFLGNNEFPLQLGNAPHARRVCICTGSGSVELRYEL